MEKLLPGDVHFKKIIQSLITVSVILVLLGIDFDASHALV
jgi:hypothetical protein